MLPGEVPSAHCVVAVLRAGDGEAAACTLSGLAGGGRARSLSACALPPCGLISRPPVNGRSQHCGLTVCRVLLWPRTPAGITLFNLPNHSFNEGRYHPTLRMRKLRLKADATCP